jgi:hypothetical protein
LDKENKQTYGNATQSVIEAYQLDPKTQYGSACQIAHDNIRKHKYLGLMYAETKMVTTGKDDVGNKIESQFGLGMMLDVAIARMLQSKYPDWWDRVMELCGFSEPKGGVNIYNNNSQTNNSGLTDEQIDERLQQLFRGGENGGEETVAGEGTESPSQSTDVRQNAPKAMGSGYGDESH